MDINSLLLEKLIDAKSNQTQLNALLIEYQPFIAKTVNEHVGHYVSYGKDDELTIGMLAFEEAIKAYDSNKGTFISFAKRLIRLRLIDYYRKHIQKYKAQGLSSNLSDEKIISQTNQMAIKEFNDQEENYELKIEILSFKEELLQWGIEFMDLVKNSPKQEKIRNQYLSIAKTIIEDGDLLNEFIHKKDFH